MGVSQGHNSTAGIDESIKCLDIFQMRCLRICGILRFLDLGETRNPANGSGNSAGLKQSAVFLF